MSAPICDWSEVAANWDRHRAGIEETNHELTEALLAGLALRPGEQVLELGAGNGELAARLSALLRPDGSLLASDVSDRMVELVEARNEGDPSVQVRRIDACAVDCDAASFDAVVFRMGLMLIPDPARALEEIHRVLRPGGRLAAAVWGSPQANPWMASVGMAAMMTGLLQGPPPVTPGGPFSLHDPVELEKLVRGAGFTDVAITTVDYTRRYRTAEEHFDMIRVLAPPIAAAFAGATPEQLEAARTMVDNLTAPYHRGDELVLPAQALVVIAR